MLRHINYVQLNNIRTFVISPIAAANHYDVLGVTPKATQRDIKEAYYKLSKVYHPDKSKDEASAKKFRDITEAYEILGNVKLKKMYDKGMFSIRSEKVDWKPEPEETDPNLRFYKSRMTQNAATLKHGKTTPIYNYDEWSQHHYSDLFQKKQREEQFKKDKNVKLNMKKSAINQELVMYSLLAAGTFFLFLVSLSGANNYDIDVTHQDKKK